MPELIVKLENITLQTCRFDGELLCIGRSRENDIVLENLSVSRQHGQIRLHEGRFILTDMTSANGILVNGVRVTKTEIIDGDVITIGKHKLIFRGDVVDSPTVIDDPAATRPPYKRSLNQVDARSEAWLTVESGRLKDREFKITRFETSLGKAPSNDVVLTDDWLLGKKQAIILRKGNDDFEIQDLGGLRRVKLNGTAISERAELKDGDVVELGGTKLLFHSNSPDGKASAKSRDELTTPAEKNIEPAPEPGVLINYVALDINQFAENESLDLEDGFGPIRYGSDSVDVLPAETPVGKETDSAIAVVSPAAKQATSKGNRQNVDDGNQRKSGRGRRHQRAAAKANVSPASSAELAKPAIVEDAGMVVTAEVGNKEIQMWEAALKNGSPAIKRQAARTLKKLTGRDYEA